jgi:hypothetical protein
MEQLILLVYVLVAVATSCVAFALARGRNGSAPTPGRLLTSFALTLPVQAFLAAAAMLLYVDILRPDPKRLRNLVLACGALLVAVAVVYARAIGKTATPIRNRIFGIGLVLALDSAALGLLLAAAYG